MIQIYLQGIMLGWILAIMVGPLTLSLLHTSIQRGRTLGMVVACGIWASDILFILAVYFGFQHVEHLIAHRHFEKGMGIIGSIVLLLIGIGILKKDSTLPQGSEAIRARDGVAAFVQGFSINTLNPFTFIFWSSVMGAVVLKNHWDASQSLVFFLGILSVLFFSDTAKVMLSRPLKKWLTNERWGEIQKISGICFIAFGFILLIRVFGR